MVKETTELLKKKKKKKYNPPWGENDTQTTFVHNPLSKN